MPKDLTVVLVNRPGTLADATEALGHAGINIDGICGFPAGTEGIVHVLVAQAGGARDALTRAGLEVREERDVVVASVEDRPGTGGALLRKIAEAGANVDLIYITLDGQVVISGPDVDAIERAVG